VSGLGEAEHLLLVEEGGGVGGWLSEAGSLHEAEVTLLGGRRREAQHLPELHGSGSGDGELRNKRLGSGEVGRRRRQ
jgi:hypothetical protein